MLKAISFRIVAGLATLLLGGCSAEKQNHQAKSGEDGAISYSNREVGIPSTDRPWITHVNVVDLDGDGLTDILACDAQTNTVGWIRQTAKGRYHERIVAKDLPGPVHVEAVDMDGDSDLDLLLSCMGQVFPNNDLIGSVIILENLGKETFKRHDIITDTYRVTDVRAGDFTGDGLLDLAVGKFGYQQGEVTWLKNNGGWNFEENDLSSLPGAVNVCIEDLNGDGSLDIVAIISQQYEELHLFENDGQGSFSDRIIFGSTNEDFGSSGISLCDLNQDGSTDILYTNGDGFDYAQPGSRPWHGVQWLENDGKGNFQYHRIADFAGAYSPVGSDLDLDGDIDIVCVSGFNDWDNPASVSITAYINDGNQTFTPQVIAHTPTHLVSVVAADLEGDAYPEFVTGGFLAYPPWGHVSRVHIWSKR
ncbi:VCBS repeat-containing protein [Pelagicoccus sp. SDUM812003]|uniref:FG-GAP repeat domain-containing protein n=1 Tax=Pelagicoccus sp. SDUM812003 TaxID=3041267 RepID=UPI00280C4ABC|nr:VCBS repeat-containing protein [Pelagicoccus sp. SDUM812003]MDQ8201957.1 VCBS repeat-containing protein [Pelagicoccus sp. SDUM812003]